MVDAVFEVSTEGGRKIGGIYTVLRSKSAFFKEKWGDNYILISYFQDINKIKHEFKEEEPPENFKKIFRELESEGVIARYGRWVKGNDARIIYLDVGRLFARGVDGDIMANYIKGFLWQNFQIDSLGDTSDFTEAAVWSYAVGMLIEKLMNLDEFKGKEVVGQFHEWLSGAGLCYCKAKKVKIATVFTTHATTLGRTLSYSGRDPILEAYNSGGRVLDKQEASKYAVASKHFMEVACAHNADAFTTVSETVGLECQYILGKKPDVITLNGFDFALFEKKAQERDRSKEFARQELLHFLHAYFTPYYHTNLKEPIITYISGRYEYTNKGFDVYIEALGRLNERLKGKSKNIYNFIFAPSNILGPKPFIIANSLLYKKIEEMLDVYRITSSAKLRERIADSPPEVAARVNEMLKSLRKDGDNPPISAYSLACPEGEDQIIKACMSNGLLNREEDVVKVIYYPTYIGVGDGLLSMSYYDLIGGTDVGVFPSRYEPYGLTPVEAGAKNNIAVTSDTTGFGRYIIDKIEKDCGVYVIKMLGKPHNDYIEELAQVTEKIYNLKPKELLKMQDEAFATLKKLVDWKEMVPLYYKAYQIAVKKAGI